MPIRKRNASGFTLIELLVTLGLLSLLLIAGTAFLRPPSTSLSLKALGMQICADLRLARAVAIARNADVVVQFDTQNRVYNGMDGAILLPEGVTVEVVFALSERRQDGVGSLRFFPSGQATGADVKLGSGDAVMAISVDWLTGDSKCDV